MKKRSAFPPLLLQFNPSSLPLVLAVAVGGGQEQRCNKHHPFLSPPLTVLDRVSFASTLIRS